jgi:hypothetical protein
MYLGALTVGKCHWLPGRYLHRHFLAYSRYGPPHGRFPSVRRETMSVAVCACPSRPAWPARRLFRQCFWSAPNRRSAAILLASTLPRAYPHADRRLISNSLCTGERNALVCTDRRVSNVTCTDRWWSLWGHLSNLVYDPGRIGAPSPRPVLQCGDATNSNTCAQNAQGRRRRVAHCTTRDAGRGPYLARPRES